MPESAKSDTIIDINKGYALRRIGAYSPNLVEQIVHTFVPLHNFCIASPTTDVCLYASRSPKSNVVELVTMMNSPTRYTSSSYTSNNVSTLIREHMHRVLTQHRPDQIIKDIKSTVHVVDNQFYYPKSEEKSLIAASSTNVVDNASNIPQLSPTTVDIILQQIKNNKIGFEYLPHTDLKLFLSTIFSTIDISYTVYNVQESLNAFTQLIVGQSIFALRYCSLNQHNSLSSQPCLAISTLFLRIPPHSTSIFSIYSLVPLPIIMDDDKYVYSNLPKVIGINSVDQTLIMWNDESDTNQCTFLPIVRCQKMPVIIPLSKSLCLSQLFDDNKLIASTCQVSRSQDIHKDFMEIDNGIWLFFNVRQPYYCQVHSDLNKLVERISINGPSVVHIPCEKTIVCTDLQISATPCIQRRVIVTPSFISILQDTPNFIVPIGNMSTTLVSTYQLQLQRSMKDVITFIKPSKSKFKQFIHDLGTYILSAICFVMFTAILYIIKFIQYKIQREINNLELIVQDMLTV